MQEQSTLSGMKFYHIALSVADSRTTAKWYQDKLGFTLLNSKEYPEFGTKISFLKLNDFRLELIEDVNSTPQKRDTPPKHTLIQGMAQFSFTIDNMDEVAEQLKAKNVDFAWGPIAYEDLGLKFLFVRDNEGNLIQFFEMLNNK